MLRIKRTVSQKCERLPKLPSKRLRWDDASKHGGAADHAQDKVLLLGRGVGRGRNIKWLPVGKVMLHEDGETWVGWVRCGPADQENERRMELVQRFEYRMETAEWVLQNALFQWGPEIAEPPPPEPKVPRPELLPSVGVPVVVPSLAANQIDLLVEKLVARLKGLNIVVRGGYNLSADEFEFDVTDGEGVGPPEGKHWHLIDWHPGKDPDTGRPNALALWAREKKQQARK